MTSVPIAEHILESYFTKSDFVNTMFSAGTKNMVESCPARSGSPEVSYEKPNAIEAANSSDDEIDVPLLPSVTRAAEAPP